MNRVVIVTLAALVLTAGTSAANAQVWGHGYSGGISLGHGAYYGSHSGYQGGLYSGVGVSTGLAPRYYSPHNSVQTYVSPGIRVIRPRWHDTTHLDYHAPSLYRHGSHYHFVPGHYDVHHTGHYDY